MTASKLFDFLGRVLMAAVFVNALPAKFTNFAETAGFIASKGIPEPLASVLLVAAIVVLIAGSILRSAPQSPPPTEQRPRGRGFPWKR